MSQAGAREKWGSVSTLPTLSRLADDLHANFPHGCLHQSRGSVEEVLRGCLQRAGLPPPSLVGPSGGSFVEAQPSQEGPSSGFPLKGAHSPVVSDSLDASQPLKESLSLSPIPWVPRLVLIVAASLDPATPSWNLRKARRETGPRGARGWTRSLKQVRSKVIAVGMERPPGSTPRRKSSAPMLSYPMASR